MKLTPKQKTFADEYILTSNAYQSAIAAGYSVNYAKGNVSKLLENVRVTAYIEQRMKEIDSKRIVDQQEVLETISRIIRGEEEGTALVGIGKGAQTVEAVPPTVAEKLKAAETMGKLFGLWTEKVQVENITPTFVEDVPEDD